MSTINFVFFYVQSDAAAYSKSGSVLVLLVTAIVLSASIGFTGRVFASGKITTEAAVTAIPFTAETPEAAGTTTADAELTMPSAGSSPWSLETSLTFHIVNIYMLKATYRYSDRVELSVGPAFQNWKNEDQSFIGQAHAYTLIMSYRYYFFRDFNVELELWPAWNNFKSFIDSNTYRGLELWIEYKLGYRMDLGRRFSLNLQPGIGHPGWMQNKWPGVEYDNYLRFLLDEMIFVPQVLLGFKF